MKSMVIYLIFFALYAKCEEKKKIYDNNYVVPQSSNQISQVDLNLSIQTACQCVSNYPPCCTPEFETVYNSPNILV